MEGEKKLLFISTRAFWKMDGGHQYGMYHYLRGLYEMYRYKIYVYTFVEDETADNNIGIPEFIESVEYAEAIRETDIIKNAVTHMFSISEPWPLQNMLFYSDRNNQEIRKLVKDLEPDAIYVDMVRLAPYIKAFEDVKCLKVLGYDDLLSERYKRQLNVSNKNANIAGAYSERLPSRISGLQKNKLIKRFILRFEASRMEKSELFYAQKYDSGIFVSSIETKKFNTKVGRKMAHTVSVGIDYYYQSEKVEFSSIPNSFSYVGNMKTAANYETVTYIIEQILPLLSIDYQFYVIGICPDDLINRYKENSRIIFTGRVDDLRPYIKATSVFLSPIAFGTGIKTKILEAFAMGMPVITNSVGIEGIEADNGIHCIVSDDTKEIAKSLENLMFNEDERKKIAENAQKLAKDKYQWEKNWLGFADAGF